MLKNYFITNSALSLYSPWHKVYRYKPASADNASNRNAPSNPNKQDAQPWGELHPQLPFLRLDGKLGQWEQSNWVHSLIILYLC